MFAQTANLIGLNFNLANVFQFINIGLFDFITYLIGFFFGLFIATVYHHAVIVRLSDEKINFIHNVLGWFLIRPVAYFFALLMYPFIMFVEPRGIWPKIDIEILRVIHMTLYYISIPLSFSFLFNFIINYIVSLIF